MIKNTCLPNRYASGSAMAEFTLLLTVLLPVGFGIVMLGKLTDLKQTTEQASRYATWEATVYSRKALAAQPAQRLDSRFFMAPDALIISGQEEQGDNAARNPLWGSASASAGSYRELASVARLANTVVLPRYQFDTAKAQASLVTGKIAAAAGRPLSGFKGNSWGIVADGMLRAGVDVAVQPTGLLHGSNETCGTSVSAQPMPSTNATQNNEQNAFCVRTAGVILADGWSSSGDAHAVSRIRSLVPGSTLSRVGKGVGKLLGSIVFPELDPLDKAFGYVDMAVLPAYTER